jgi:hypothetical protein
VGRDTRSFNSRRSSTDSSEDGGGLGGGVRELRQEMRDLEDKFKKAMVANASLDNEKCQLIFQVNAEQFSEFGVCWRIRSIWKERIRIRPLRKTGSDFARISIEDTGTSNRTDVSHPGLIKYGSSKSNYFKKIRGLTLMWINTGREK